MYRVHLGFNDKGKDRWKRFNDLNAAKKFCEKIFRKTGRIIALEKKK